MLGVSEPLQERRKRVRGGGEKKEEMKGGREEDRKARWIQKSQLDFCWFHVRFPEWLPLRYILAEGIWSSENYILIVILFFIVKLSIILGLRVRSMIVRNHIC